ncbi:hypothetical protein RD792_002834 [Penstemon davidsonii]|uniref:Membrane insertase YidC/Oxa/ALB C-terminal domain-containing protein n=1 Tax=Penstemon davidsonii TaxID=160366 RepID=A0ABR0DSL0_9LAMI|nr:hypothetical protein RD792_002834 [Penstemon davidsonii]
MARTLISSPSFLGTPLPSLSRHGHAKHISTRVNFSFQELPPIHSFDGSSIDFKAIFERAESVLYTLADAAVAADPAGVASSDSAAAAQKNGGWFGFISDAMEVVLKVLKDGLSTVHVPYAYGFAIILLTVLVKVATFPLTKQQVESTMAMQNLQPKIKAIQQRYAGNQVSIFTVISVSPRTLWDDRLALVTSVSALEYRKPFKFYVIGVSGFGFARNCYVALVMRYVSFPSFVQFSSTVQGDWERIQLETSRLYTQAGVNPLAGCLPTLATIPVFIGLYQALSNVANEGLLTEGFFWIPSLGGPTSIAARQSGSGISWLFPFVDGHPPLGWSDTAAYLVLPVLLVLSQYVSMEIMKPPQTDDPAQKNTLLVFKFLPLMIGYFSLSVPSGLSIYWFTNNVLSTAQQVWLRKLGGAKPAVNENAGGIITAGRAKRSSVQSERTGERFKQLKEDEKKKNTNALPADDIQTSASDSEEDSNNETESKDKEVREEALASSSSKPVPNYSGPRRSKRSKQKRTV